MQRMAQQITSGKWRGTAFLTLTSSHLWDSESLPRTGKGTYVGFVTCALVWHPPGRHGVVPVQRRAAREGAAPHLNMISQADLKNHLQFNQNLFSVYFSG